MRQRLFAAASLIALAASPALAQQTVEDERTEPVDTANADGQGNASDLVISSTGRVTLTGGAGPAVTINSDNSLTTEAGSRITILDVDANGDPVDANNSVGIKIDDGVTGDLTHGGVISMTDDFVASDSGTDNLRDLDGDGVFDDPDREPDGPFAEDRNKTAILVGDVDANFDPVANQTSVTGSVVLESTGSITVAGQDSFGLRTVTDVSGDVSARSSISVRGERSRGVSIEADVGGSVELGSMSVASPNGEGAVIEGDVGGGLRLVGAIDVSGYRVPGRVLEAGFQLLDPGDDDINSGSAVIIGGHVANGVFVAGGSSVTAQTGAGFAVEIRPDADRNADLRIGESIVPDDFSSDFEDDDEDPTALGYAVVNRGGIQSNGIYDGRDSTAFVVMGRDDNGIMRLAVLESGGLSNEGDIRATAYDATATAMRFGAGAQADAIHNTGQITATAALGFEEDGFSDDDPDTASVEGSFGQGRAVALVLEDGSSLRQLLNETGAIVASVVGGGAGATAIRVESGSLETLRNSGLIAAQAGNLEDAFSVDTIELIAIDARGHAAGLTLIQETDLDDNGDELATPQIVGDILFGEGDDQLELRGGAINGDIEFGVGADVLIIDGGELQGAISDSDGALTVSVANGVIELAGSEALTLTEATFSDGGELRIDIDTADRTAAFVTASGAVTFDAGSSLSVSLANLIGAGREFEVITAGDLSFADEDATLSANDAPFLYNASFSRDPADADTLVLTLERKTAAELGFNANRGAAYDEAFAAFEAVEALGAAMAGLRTQQDFFNAYDQLLPEYAGSAIQFALASNDAAAGALSTRLQNARLAPDDLAGVWAQEFGYFADRAGTAFGPGYRGQGVGLAIGLDRPVGPFYAVGVQLVGAASEVEEADGFDEPMVAITGQVGGYAALDMGGFDISGSIGLGYDHFETERSVLIGAFSAANQAEWTGWHASLSGQIGRDFAMGRWVVRPEAGLTYLALFESGYTEQAIGLNAEDNGALALIVDDRETSTLIGSATTTLARRFGTDASWWAPSVRLGYRGEFAGQAGDTTARFGETGSPFTLQAEELPGTGLLLGFGLSAGSNYSTFSFAYDADVREDFVRHVARLVIRLTF